MPECPVCEREFESQGSNSYSEHVQAKHPLYWARARRLRQIATVNLVVSLSLTVLLVTFFYSPDELGYTVMGLATLFLAISAAFSLRERGLGKRYSGEDSRRGRSKAQDGKGKKNRGRKNALD